MTLDPDRAASRRRWFLAAGVGLRLVLAAALPPGEAPDERAHLAYVRALDVEGRIPVQRRAVSPDAIDYEYYQPPLWYLTAVPFHRAGRLAGDEGPLYAVRLWNVLLSAAFLAASLALVARIVADESSRAAAASFLAFWPALAANGAGAGNDPLAALLVALCLLPAVRIASGERCAARRGALLAVGIGLSLLTKMTGLVLLPLVGLAFALRGRSLVAAARATPILLGGVAVAAPWYARNVRVYGDPFALGVGNVEWVDRPEFPRAVLEVVSTTARTLWVAFGRHNEIVAPGIGAIAVALTAALVVVGAVRLARTWRGLEPAMRRRIVLLAAGGVALAGLSLSFGFRYHQPQGRFLFPLAGPLALGAVATLVPPGRPGAERLAGRVGAGLLVLFAWGFAPVVAKFYPSLVPFGPGPG